MPTAKIGAHGSQFHTGWHMRKTPIHLIHEGTRTQGLIVDYEKRYNLTRRSWSTRSVTYMKRKTLAGLLVIHKTRSRTKAAPFAPTAFDEFAVSGICAGM
jgi:hypothetical protein